MLFMYKYRVPAIANSHTQPHSEKARNFKLGMLHPKPTPFSPSIRKKMAISSPRII
jgi:hypothetical protein